MLTFKRAHQFVNIMYNIMYSKEFIRCKYPLNIMHLYMVEIKYFEVHRMCSILVPLRWQLPLFPLLCLSILFAKQPKKVSSDLLDLFHCSPLPCILWRLENLLLNAEFAPQQTAGEGQFARLSNISGKMVE